MGRARDHRLQIRQGADGGARRREPHALPRLPGRELQALRLRRLGGDGGGRRRALRAAGRHHQPERIRARQFDRGGDLGRGRRPRDAGRRGDRRDRGQFRQDLVHRRVPRILALWPRPALRPRHAVPAQGAARPCAATAAREGRAPKRPRSPSRKAPTHDRRRRPRPHLIAALSRRDQRLVRRLQGAARSVAGARARRNARDHRSQRRRQDDDDGRHHRQDAPRRGRCDVRRKITI